MLEINPNNIIKTYLKHSFHAVFLFLLFTQISSAQDTNSVNKVLPKSTNLILTDSTKQSSNVDSVMRSTKKIPYFEMKKSPLGAVLRSMVLPGWGQLYVESYWKAPIFFMGNGLCVYSILYFNKKYNHEVDQLSKIDTKNPANIYTVDSLKSYREYYRDNRDMSGFYLLGVYILAAVDAYVGAHLYDFSVSDNLSYFIAPDRLRGITLNVQYKW